MGSTIQSARICIEGSTIIDNGGTHPNLKTNCRTAVDPFAGKLPVPSNSACSHTNLVFNGGTANLMPGVYCGGVNFNSGTNVTLAPGLYVIRGGDWNVNGGTWTGSDVTFYFEDTSRIQFNSAITSSMSAPSTGSYAGILIYEKEGLSRSPFVIDDSKGSDLTGLIYLPSRDTIFNSDSKANGEKITMVFNTLILDQTKWRLVSASKSISAGPDVVTTTTTTTTTPGSPYLQQ